MCKLVKIEFGMCSLVDCQAQVLTGPVTNDCAHSLWQEIGGLAELNVQWPYDTIIVLDLPFWGKGMTSLTELEVALPDNRNIFIGLTTLCVLFPFIIDQTLISFMTQDSSQQSHPIHPYMSHDTS